MKTDTLERVESFWCTLLGTRPASLFRGISVSEHVGLGDYAGVVVVARGDGCHISAPRPLLGPVTLQIDRFSRDGRPAGDLLSAGWWRRAMGPSYDVLGPAVHHYLDHDRHLPAPEPVSQDRALLAGLRDAVDPGEWAEGGFGEDPETVFVAAADGRPVAAANLTDGGSRAWPRVIATAVRGDPLLLPRGANHDHNGSWRTVVVVAPLTSLL